MKPKITVITLGVSDFARSLDFYKKGLRWPTKAKKKDTIAFFQLSNIILALFDKKGLAEDAGVSAKGSGFPGITLAHNTASKKEVDDIFRTVKKLGAKVVKAPQKASWGSWGGYSGYFTDPDGYLWEVVYNPSWKLDRKGNVVLH